MGCFLDPVSIMLITLPIFLPILQNMGVNLIWLGVILTLNMEIANITPPVGFNLFVLHGMGKQYGVRMEDIIAGSTPYVLLLALGIVILVIFPQLALWLPNTMR